MYSFSHSLLELRLRVWYSLFATTCAFGVSYSFRNQLVYLWSKPFLSFSNQFIFFDLPEALTTMIQLAGWSTVCAMLPYGVYQGCSFFLPSRYESERRKITLGVQFMLWWFFGGFLCISWGILPSVWDFLLSFRMASPDFPVEIELTPRLGSYFSFSRRVFLFFLGVFQIPFLFVYFFSQKLLTSSHLCAARKPVSFLCVVSAAAVSPPDGVIQLTVSCVFFAMYEMMIFVGFFFEKPQGQRQ